MNAHLTVGVDGSPESRAAARWAAQEAVLRQVPLRLVHAVDRPLEPVFATVRHQDMDRWADQVLTDATRELHRRHPQLEITTRCLAARPAAALAAEATDAALLILGSRGLGGLVGFVVGSVAMSTLVATGTPIVLVRVADDPDGPGPGTGSDVIVGVDIHTSCDRVLTFAFEEADRRHCALRAVHGWKLPPAYAYVPFFDPDDERDVDRSVTRMLEDMLLPWRHKFPDVEVGHSVFRGSAGDHLVRASQGAGLVVVGRHLRRSPLGAHLGPVTHAVLHHAAAPVAVVAHE
ncbi:universal stress protein [Streptomyces sp. WAC06614]|uniref:universal stress protein n=1 Tax=Streptomyces sp. WAC06614 TaxID=2487416 RepID=UPI000F7B155B|nr:universal stress protein [Streptomyces sp. WAC06614]RSS79718.1 universal stress protein [Streptomyces sp. WAC06614]